MAALTQVTDRIWYILTASPRSCRSCERTWPEPWCRSAQIPRTRPGLLDYERSAAWRSSGWSPDRFKTWRTCTLADVFFNISENGVEQWLSIHWVIASLFRSNQRFELWYLLCFLAKKDLARSFAVHGMFPKANSGCAETSPKVSVEWLPFSRAIGSCSQLSRSRDKVDGSSVFPGCKEDERRKGWHSPRNPKNTQELSWAESSWVELSVAESI